MTAMKSTGNYSGGRYAPSWHEMPTTKALAQPNRVIKPGFLDETLHTFFKKNDACEGDRHVEDLPPELTNIILDYANHDALIELEKRREAARPKRRCVCATCMASYLFDMWMGGIPEYGDYYYDYDSSDEPEYPDKDEFTSLKDIEGRSASELTFTTETDAIDFWGSDDETDEELLDYYW